MAKFVTVTSLYLNSVFYEPGTELPEDLDPKVLQTLADNGNIEPAKADTGAKSVLGKGKAGAETESK